MSPRRPNLFEQLVRPLLREPAGTLTLTWDHVEARASFTAPGIDRPLVSLVALRPPAGPGDERQVALFDEASSLRQPPEPEAPAPPLLRLSCSAGVQAVCDGEEGSAGLDWSLADEPEATKAANAAVVAWWNEGSGDAAEAVACVDAATADVLERAHPTLTFRRQPLPDADEPIVLRVGMTLYASHVVRPSEAIDAERYTVKAIADDVVAQGADARLSPVWLSRAQIERVPGRHATEGVTPTFWRVRTPVVQAKRPSRRKLSPPSKPAPAAPAPEAFREGQRVRVRAGMAGIDGVPVSLAGEVVTVASVGPKRVKVRPDGRGKTYAVSPRALDRLDDGGKP